MNKRQRRAMWRNNKWDILMIVFFIFVFVSLSLVAVFYG